MIAAPDFSWLSHAAALPAMAAVDPRTPVATDARTGGRAFAGFEDVMRARGMHPGADAGPGAVDHSDAIDTDAAAIPMRRVAPLSHNDFAADTGEAIAPTVSAFRERAGPAEGRPGATPQFAQMASVQGPATMTSPGSAAVAVADVRAAGAGVRSASGDLLSLAQRTPDWLAGVFSVGPDAGAAFPKATAAPFATRFAAGSLFGQAVAMPGAAPGARSPSTPATAFSGEMTSGLIAQAAKTGWSEQQAPDPLSLRDVVPDALATSGVPGDSTASPGGADLTFAATLEGVSGIPAASLLDEATTSMPYLPVQGVRNAGTFAASGDAAVEQPKSAPAPMPNRAASDAPAGSVNVIATTDQDGRSVTLLVRANGLGTVGEEFLDRQMRAAASGAGFSVTRVRLNGIERIVGAEA